MRIDICKLHHLNDLEYAIVGGGGYVGLLLNALQQANIKLPKVILDECAAHSHMEGIPICSIDTENSINHFVLGSNVYQLEITERVIASKGDRVNIWDVSPFLSEDNYFYQENPSDANYVVIYASDPKQQPEYWLANFNKWLQSFSISVVYRHPMQRVSDDFLTNSQAIILWNGSLGCFHKIKETLNRLGKPYSFCECGFFPQERYFYFDKAGINAASQLNNDDLSWLGHDVDVIVDKKKMELFNGVSVFDKETNYVFVPLQLGTDANVQNHSRFTSGMQEFIDYIEDYYTDEVLIFKAHPKDRKKDSYRLRKGKWSDANSLSLIQSAKRVHGINSTVLFEAALFGVDIIAEGECLLNSHEGKMKEIIAAMIKRQFDAQSKHFDLEQLSQFSYLNFFTELSYE